MSLKKWYDLIMTLSDNSYTRGIKKLNRTSIRPQNNIGPKTKGSHEIGYINLDYNHHTTHKCNEHNLPK